MKLAKAIQIATEAISLQRLKIAFDANMLRVYHVDTIRTRACSELYQTYSEAINLLNELVTKSVPVMDHYVASPLPSDLQGLVTGSPPGTDHADTNPTLGPPSSVLCPSSPVFGPPSPVLGPPSPVLGPPSPIPGPSKGDSK